SASGVVPGAWHRSAPHPARQAGSESVRRTLQSQLPRRRARCLRVRVRRRGPSGDGGVDRGLQQRAAARQPRSGTSANVHAEASTGGGVRLSTVSLTGEPTSACTDLKLCNKTGGLPQTVNCAASTITSSVPTNAAGQVTMVALGAGLSLLCGTTC